tara:strand:+ start:13950 stop:14681 length:732 start_codon:yes stop_codon:yes gene_type:complete
MATFVQTDVGLYWGGHSLASSFNAIALNMGNAPQDDTVYGDSFQSNASGLSSIQAEAEGFWQSTTDSVLHAGLAINAADTVLSVTPTGSATVGLPSIFSKVTTSTYNPISTGTVGSMMGFSLSAEGVGEKSVTGEILVVPNTYSSSSESATNSSIGAVSATQSLYSALHVTAVSGTLDVIVESAPSNWSSETTRITHTQYTTGGGVGAEIKSIAGAITDAHWRVKWTISGGGSFNFICSLGIT